MTKQALSIVLCLLLLGCAQEAPTEDRLAAYFDNTGREDTLSGGVRMIPIETPAGTFHVWTRRTGNNPKIKVLLLHGGPGATHEYLQAFDSYFPGAGIEYYFYDQLGSAFSDQPDNPELWEIDRFVDEVEQVRTALGLNADNFVLFGQSWGGLLAIEYALAHPQNLKALIVSNMMSSIPAYNEYAKNELMPAMNPAALAEIQALEKAEDYKNPRYMELLVPEHYEKHILRMPAAEWPNPVHRAFAALNYVVYLRMQGPSELGASGKILNWDRTADLPSITVPTLVVGARYDSMDPKHMEWMAKQFPKGSYLYCPEGSHLAMYDDQETYFGGGIEFLRRLDS
ncbi:MAG: proline iminopeptidase-family hydrolase [Steroidobacteraceae bacterium]